MRGGLLFLISVLAGPLALQAAELYYTVNAAKVTGPWSHFFQECVGSGHAALALRGDYQSQLAAVRRDLGFKRIRFHGLLVDDMSVVLPAFNGSGLMWSFFNIDRIFDSFLSIGVRPLVEIGFMPSLLASGNTTWSHYDANVTPPSDWGQWADLITALAQHLVDRYGLDELLTWNFEVWNEPNCCGDTPVFWTGGQAGYFYLFNVTSRAIKSVDPRLRVGGPATAMSAWIPDFLNYTRASGVPFDFISTHEYPTDPPGPQTRTFFRDRLALTRGIVGPDTPLYYTEYDDAYNDDTAYSAAFIVFQNRAVSGLVDLLSFWPFSDLFEEGGLYPVPFDRAGLAVDGLVNVYGIPKPSYRAFQLLAWSGDSLLDSQPDFLAHPTVGLFAVGGNGTSVFITNWNVKGQPIDDYNVTVTVSGLPGAAARSTATLYRIDDSNGNAYPAWQAMGSPQYLSPQQVQALTLASAMTPASVPLTVLAADTVQFTAFVAGNTVVNIILT